MVFALHSLGSSVPTLPRYPSPPYRGSSSPTDFGVSAQSNAAEIAPIEEGDSRDSVERSSDGCDRPFQN